MAKAIFLILLLLDFLALGWGYLSSEQRANMGREPQRVLTQMSPDKVRIVASADQCYAYSGATLTEAQEIAKTLADSLFAARVVVKSLVTPTVFEVVIPGYTRRSSADLRVAELKQLAFGRGADVRKEGEGQFAIVVVSSTSRSTAEATVKSLDDNGLRSALIKVQPTTERSVIEVRGNATALSLLPALILPFKILQATTCTTP
jgi:hypothetical protein